MSACVVVSEYSQTSVPHFEHDFHNMAITQATWSHIVSSQRLCRSSQAVSVVGQETYVFGGELKPRQPVDSQMDVVRAGNAQCEHPKPDFQPVC